MTRAGASADANKNGSRVHRPASKSAATAPVSALSSGAGLCRAQSGSAQGSEPEEFAIVAAIASLYVDELRPYGRILRKRLSERAAVLGDAGLDIDATRMRSLCEGGCCGLVVVEPEDEAAGGDWSALLHGRAATFVDVYSPVDPYPETFWEAAARCFTRLEGESVVLPGGRYACAQELRARDLECLQGLSLGQVCHVVQLAISQRKLLGYFNGAVVPYAQSQSMLKEHCAGQQRPCVGLGKTACPWPIATWDTARACIREMLTSSGIAANGTDEKPASEALPLSNVKRLFRSRFHVELSETALGYSKLSELLKDPRLQDICSVHLRGQGYIVVPATSIAETKRAEQDFPQTSAPSAVAESNGLQTFCVGQTFDGFCGPQVAPCAPQVFCVGQPLGSSCGPQMAPSGPHDFCLGHSINGFCGPQVAHCAPVCVGQPFGSSCGPQEAPRGLQTICIGKPLDGFCPPVFQVAPSDPQAFCVGKPLDVHCGPSASSRPQAFCVGEPLDFDGEEGGPPQPRPTTSFLSPSTLAKDGRIGSVVRNTFIHAAAPPPTPPVGRTLRRSSSLPRDLFSEKSAWETNCHALGFRPQPVARAEDSEEESNSSSQAFCVDEPLDFDLEEEGVEHMRCPYTPVKTPFTWPETPEASFLNHAAMSQVVRLSELV